MVATADGLGGDGVYLSLIGMHQLEMQVNFVHVAYQTTLFMA